ncbi:MAG: hypothetical protein AAF572_00190 [Cyanobacteria bacterium P01_B01_bin.77]
MTRTLEKSQALTTYASNGNVIVPFEVVAPVNRATQIRQHLEYSTSLPVLNIAQDYLRSQPYSKPINSKPVRMMPTSSGPRSKPIRPQY